MTTKVLSSGDTFTVTYSIKVEMPDMKRWPRLKVNYTPGPLLKGFARPLWDQI